MDSALIFGLSKKKKRIKKDHWESLTLNLKMIAWGVTGLGQNA